MPLIDSTSLSPSYQPISGIWKGKQYNIKGAPITFPLNGDLKGSDTFLANFWQQQQQNAYELELWNLQNRYNLPINQMSRFQQAGLNPNLIYSQQNTASSPAGSSAPIAAKPTNFKAQNTLGALDAAGRIMQGLNNVIGQVRDTYDYAKYGTTEHRRRNELLFNQVANTQLQGDLLENQLWVTKVLNGEIPLTQEYFRDIDNSSYTAGSVPSIQRYLNTNEKTAQEIERVQRYLNEMFPLEKANVHAGTELRTNELEWNKNIRDFVDSINTGVPWLDSLLKAIMRVASGRLGVN